MEFRPFHPSDAGACVEVFDSRVESYFDPGERQEFLEYLGALEHPDSVEEDLRFWTGWESGQMVACGGFEVLANCAYLCYGIVRENQGGRGLGRALLKHRLDEIGRWPVEIGSVFSDTAPKTEGFYAKFGFVTYYRKPHYWVGTLDLVAMELSRDGELRGHRRVREDGSIGYRVL